MNESKQSDGMADGAAPTHAERSQVPNTSMLPGTEKPLTATEGMLRQAVQGAHASIDRLAKDAAPVMQQLEDGVSASHAAMRAKVDQLRDVRDAWAEGARSTVRSNPLASVAAAVALGLLIARINRWRQPTR